MDYVLKQIRYNVWQVVEVNRNAEREVGIIVQDDDKYSARPTYHPEWTTGLTSLDAAKQHVVDHITKVTAND